MVPAAQKSHDAPTSSLHWHTRWGETKNNNNNALASLPVEPVLTPLLLHPSDQQHDRPALTTAAKVERASARESEWLAVAASCTRTEEAKHHARGRGGRRGRRRRRRRRRRRAYHGGSHKMTPSRQSERESRARSEGRECYSAVRGCGSAGAGVPPRPSLPTSRLKKEEKKKKKALHFRKAPARTPARQRQRPPVPTALQDSRRGRPARPLSSVRRPSALRYTRAGFAPEGLNLRIQ